MMKPLVFLALLLCACFVAASAGHSKQHQSVNVVAVHGPAGGKSTTVTFSAETREMTPPLRFHWSLGNGNEWEGPKPPPQNYGGGRYDVIVTVTDSDGLVRKASLTVDVEGEHEH
mgnify:CR=1 FL=1